MGPATLVASSGLKGILLASHLEQARPRARLAWAIKIRARWVEECVITLWVGSPETSRIPGERG